MNSKKILGISIAAILAISAVSLSALPEAFAKNDFAGKPDFVAVIDTPANPHHYNGEKGLAMFWVDADSMEDPDMRIAYKIILQKIDVGETTVDEDPTKQVGNDKNSGKGLATYLWKLHIHPAPDGVHDASKHYLNIVGPTDDDELKIAGHTLTGVWDKDDWQDLGNDLHESNDPVEVIAEMCSSDIDINVHSEVHHTQVRGQLIPTSDFCE